MWMKENTFKASSPRKRSLLEEKGVRVCVWVLQVLSHFEALEMLLRGPQCTQLSCVGSEGPAQPVAVPASSLERLDGVGTR